MKHRFTVPYADAKMPDIGGWAHAHGWHVTGCQWLSERLSLRPGPAVLTVTLVPFHGMFPDHTVQITASSGATLIYDDADRSMAVTLQPEPEDARPDRIEDARA